MVLFCFRFHTDDNNNMFRLFTQIIAIFACNILHGITPLPLVNLPLTEHFTYNYFYRSDC